MWQAHRRQGQQIALRLPLPVVRQLYRAPETLRYPLILLNKEGFDRSMWIRLAMRRFDKPAFVRLQGQLEQREESVAVA